MTISLYNGILKHPKALKSSFHEILLTSLYFSYSSKAIIKNLYKIHLKRSPIVTFLCAIDYVSRNYFFYTSLNPKFSKKN